MQVQALQIRDGAGQKADGQADAPVRTEHVDPQPPAGNRERQVRGPVLLELALLPRIQNCLHQLVHVLRGEHVLLLKAHLAVAAAHKRVVPGDVQVCVPVIIAGGYNLFE